jgi:hypothetical protein
MIRLNLPKEPYWILVPSGVKVLVRPLRTAINETAKARLTRLARELADHVAAVKAAGGTVEDLPDLTTKDGLSGAGAALYAESLAIAGVIAWEGPVDDDDNPLSPTADAITEWMAQYPADAESFVVQYTAPLVTALAAGKGSRPSPSGTSAAGPSIASGAETPGSLAPTGS